MTVTDLRLYPELARRAVEENWGQCYSSSRDMAEPLPAGTVDEITTPEDEEHGERSFRIWCHDETARNVPPQLVPEAELATPRRV